MKKLIAVLIFAASFVAPAKAEPDWRSGYKTPGGVDCCAEHDCRAMPRGFYVKRGDRYKVFDSDRRKTEITIVHPSQDGKTYICNTGCAFQGSIF